MDEFSTWLEVNQDDRVTNPGFTRLRITTDLLRGNRGLVSRVNLPPGSCCLSVPIDEPRLILTPFRCVEYLNRCGCFQSSSCTLAMNPLDSLVLFLFHVSLTDICPLNQYWKPYFRVLPSVYSDPIFGASTFPTYCPLAFESLDLRVQFGRVRKRLHQSWYWIRKLLTDQSGCQQDPPDKFVWAWCTVNSRCVYCSLADFDRESVRHLADQLNLSRSSHAMLRLASNAHETNVALIPFFDFFNHSAKTNCRLVANINDRIVQLFIDEPISVGEQAFINYGSHDNLSLLLEYGFSLSLEENPNDAIYPTSVDLESIFNNRIHAHLDVILSGLSLEPVSSSPNNPVLWPTICFSRTGPSFHLLLVLHMLHSFEKQNPNDGLSKVDWNRLYELNEDILVRQLRSVLLKLITELKRQQQTDYVIVLRELQLVPAENHGAFDCLRALERFLQNREQLLNIVQSDLLSG